MIKTSKKEQNIANKSHDIIKPISQNSDELNKYKSPEINQQSPRIDININRQISSKNNKRFSLKENYSGIKNFHLKQNINETSDLKNKKNLNNTNEKEKIIRIENNHINNSDEKFERNKNCDKTFKKENRVFLLKSEKNLVNLKTKAANKILRDSESFKEIEINEAKKRKSIKPNINSSKMVLKEQQKTINNPDNNTNNNHNEDKPKNENKDKTVQNKKIIDNKKEDIYEDIILNDNEFDNKILQTKNLRETQFPKLSLNPFIVKPAPLEKIEIFNNKKCNSNKNIIQLKNNYIKQDEENKDKENSIINNHMKSSTIVTNHLSSTTMPNSSNLNSTIEMLNTYQNSNISNKKEDNNSICEIENYRELLLLAKRGDKEKFVDLFGQISSLQNNLFDINFQDENGYSALHYSSDEGNLKIVEFLLNANCDPNLRSNEKETPLHLSSKRGYFDISKLLIENGAELNIYNNEKNSPLHFVCMNNYIELFKYFLTKHPKIDIKNIYGKMPIDLTTNEEMIELFQDYLNKNGNKYNNLLKSKIKNLKEKDLKKEVKNLNKDKNNQNGFKRNDANAHKDKFVKNQTSNSPLSRSPKNTVLNKKNEINNNNEEEEFGRNIKKKNTLPRQILMKMKASNTLNLDNNRSNINELNSSEVKNKKAKNEKNNMIFQKVELKNNNKLNESEEEDTLININYNISNNINQNEKLKENNILNNSSINLQKYLKNRVKRKKIIDIFSSNNKDKENTDKSKLYNSISKKHMLLNESGINKNNNNESMNIGYNRINLSIGKSRESNDSMKKYSKERKIMNNNEKKTLHNKSKFYQNNLKTKKLDSTELYDKNLVNLNKTDENIKIIQNNEKHYIKKSKLNSSKNVNIHKPKIETTERKIVKNKKLNKTKNIDNSLINNCNITKISCANNKNRIILDKMNKNNLVDQTFSNNTHKKLNLNSMEDEKISPTSFVCLAQLGKGSFGEVYLVQKINSQKKYAMKVLRKERIMGQNLLKYAIAERNVLSLTQHPFIVKLNYSFQSSTKLFLVLEYCPNGDLAKHLLFEKRFSEKRAKFYLCEVLLALENLHERDVIFRDLKPDNVVLDEEGHCKLTDFGLSKEGVSENTYAQSFCGSIAYLAPEMLKKQGHGKAVDWYLLGVLFYEMLIGITPFFTLRKEEIFHNIEYGELKIPDFVSKEASELLRGLLERDPNKRLGSKNDAQEIKEHPYFKDVNWDDVYNKKIKPPIFMNYMSKIIHLYHKPRLFTNDDLFSKTSDKPDPQNLMGWSFVNSEEDNFDQ